MRNNNCIADALEMRFGSRMVIDGDRILFTAPKMALVATLFGNPACYRCASLMMQFAEREHRLWGMVRK